MEYSKLIKRIRKNVLLTQSELAKELQVSFATINRWENKKCVPTIRARRKIKSFCISHNIDFE